MKNLERYLEKTICEDLKKKMVFVGGPRQVGKTTLARIIGNKFNNPSYLNWDNRKHRNNIIKEMWSPESDLIIFDEIHKYSTWKSHVKGIWDVRENNEKILITGSSRLDIYRKGGDSLLGRYHYHRLHPFSVSEIMVTMSEKYDYFDKTSNIRYIPAAKFLSAFI
jgi:hypothetical protein